MISSMNPSDEFLAKWLNGDLDATELEAWNAEEGHEDLKRIVAHSSQLEIPARQSKAEAWEKIQSQLIDESEKQSAASSSYVRPLWRRPLFNVAAATVLVALLAYLVWPQSIHQVQSGIGEQISQNLPDGSMAQLAPLSQISYFEDEWTNNRTLQLSGEAFFQVKSGSDFLVNSPAGQVRVLGTSFNVSAFKDEAWTVSCYTGKVEVSSASEKVILTPGQHTELINGKFETSKMEAADQPLWVQGQRRYENVPFHKVLLDFYRHYGIKAQVSESISQRPYTGGFILNDLEDALFTVFNPVGLEAKMDSKGQLILNQLE